MSDPSVDVISDLERSALEIEIAARMQPPQGSFAEMLHRAATNMGRALDAMKTPMDVPYPQPLQRLVDAGLSPHYADQLQQRRAQAVQAQPASPEPCDCGHAMADHDGGKCNACPCDLMPEAQPASAPDVEAIKARLLKERPPVHCRVLSMGDDCTCFLCDLDKLVALARLPAPETASAGAEVEAIVRETAQALETLLLGSEFDPDDACLWHNNDTAAVTVETILREALTHASTGRVLAPVDLWQPIETAPETERVWIWVANLGAKIAQKTTHPSDGAVWWDGEEQITRPTAWHPLPGNPPAALQRAREGAE